jgi:hypothetical protein
MYIQEKRDPVHLWVATSYKLTSDNVCLIANDWDEEWKLPTEEMGNPDEEEEQDNENEELDEGQGNRKCNDAWNTPKT